MLGNIVNNYDFEYFSDFSSCPDGWFECGYNSTECVHQRHICDKKDDCDNGNDEVDCGKETNYQIVVPNLFIFDK